MTTTHLALSIEKIKEDLLKMGGMVEESLDGALHALTHRDAVLARSIIEKDVKINELENKIDAICVKLIATQQPVAIDLRVLTVAMRLATIMERTGDQAVNIADRALILEQFPPLEIVPPTLLAMGALAMDMTRKSLDAFVQRSSDLAYDVCCQDDELDELNRQLLEQMIGWMMDEQRLIRRGVELILAGRHLERVGDQATNIAEEVVFMVEGTVIRHRDICSPKALRDRAGDSDLDDPQRT